MRKIVNKLATSLILVISVFVGAFIYATYIDINCDRYQREIDVINDCIELEGCNISRSDLRWKQHYIKQQEKCNG